VTTPSGPGPRIAWHAGALAAFLGAAFFLSCEVWRQGPRETVLANAAASNGEPLVGFWKLTSEADTTFVAWLVGRNARTLVTRPWALFEAEHCAPARNALTLSEPMLTLGLLAVPGWLLTGDPILAYNTALLALRVLMALALYALVVAWTRSPPAGIAAGLLYAFHPVWTRDVTHAFIYDTGWTALALLFAQRLFSRGRWRDALGLGLCIALQMGTSLYPMIAAVCLALPFTAWLLTSYRLRNLRRPGPPLLALGIVLVAAALVYSPYLFARDGGDALHAGMQLGTTWGSFLPGGAHFPGWALLLLALAGLALGARGSLAGLDVDPRWALLLGAALVAWVSTSNSQPSLGSLQLPNLYQALAALIPGLESVRVVGRVSVGVHLVLCLLAGLGAAALLARVPAGRARFAAIGLLLCLAAVATLWPRLLGIPERLGYRVVDVRPAQETLELFREAEAQGSQGPLAELPLRSQGRITLLEESRRILLNAWHRRRTSACYGSFQPAGQAGVKALLKDLPQPEAVRGVRELGFETVVLRGPAAGLRERFDRASAGPAARIRLLAERGERSVWELYAPAD